MMACADDVGFLLCIERRIHAMAAVATRATRAARATIWNILRSPRGARSQMLCYQTAVSDSTTIRQAAPLPVMSFSRLIADISVDRERFDDDLTAIPDAPHRYAILYISRSGSTWLADLLSRQGALGKPREYLNLDMIARFAAEMNANSLADYFAMLRRKRSTANGVFGIKIGWAQLALLAEEAPIEEFLAGYSWIYLRRRNAVAQAVSLYKARSSGAYQRRRSDSANVRLQLDEADGQVAYDVDGLRDRLREIVTGEHVAERMMAAAGISPVRMTYEDMMTTEKSALISMTYRLLFAADVPQLRTSSSNIERSGNAQNLEFESRLRKDEAQLIDRLERQRPPLIVSSPV